MLADLSRGKPEQPICRSQLFSAAVQRGKDRGEARLRTSQENRPDRRLLQGRPRDARVGI